MPLTSKKWEPPLINPRILENACLRPRRPHDDPLGAMTLLAESKNFNGTVRAIFQPAEEPGKGAKAMIDDGLLKVSRR